jgi:hypothetical protein
MYSYLAPEVLGGGALEKGYDVKVRIENKKFEEKKMI